MGKALGLKKGDSVNGFVVIQNLGRIYYKSSKYKRTMCEFVCPFCNEKFIAIVQNIKNGNSTNCGCVARENKIRSNTKHGLSNTRLYKIWKDIKKRCYNKKATAYKNYGGRGITVCKEWEIFLNFYNWAINNNYNSHLCIDRINNDGNYEPSNCRWVGYVTNTQNTRILKSNNTSGYRGVSFHKSTNNWQSAIQNNKKTVYLGVFKTKEEAAIAYNNYVIEHKTFHPLNIIE
jgi:transcription elongation factor Elf1